VEGFSCSSVDLSSSKGVLDGFPKTRIVALRKNFQTRLQIFSSSDRRTFPNTVPPPSEPFLVCPGRNRPKDIIEYRGHLFLVVLHPSLEKTGIVRRAIFRSPCSLVLISTPLPSSCFSLHHLTPNCVSFRSAICSCCRSSDLRSLPYFFYHFGLSAPSLPAFFLFCPGPAHSLLVPPPPLPFTL